MPRVKPQVLKGTRDFLPSRMILRQRVMGVIRQVFERFGFSPMETPALEYAETLEGKYGEEGDRLMYRFVDQGGRNVALRYDLSVPLSRVVAMYPDLVKPFKRYQISPVWRADRPQKGRYREFWQCDIDIVGTRSMLADAEIVAVTYQALTELGFRHFVVRINNRRLLNGLAHYAGVPAQEAAHIYRSIDKLEKIGLQGVEEEMLAAGVPREAAERVLSLVGIEQPGSELLDTLSQLLAANAEAEAGIADLREVLDYLALMAIPERCYRVDLSLARGLEYYTGSTFETVVEEPRIGSITGGGRYDKLVGMFADRDFPAVGTSLGLERIVTVMEELGMATAEETTAQVLVTVFNISTAGASLSIANSLRQSGLRTETYLDVGDRLGAQLRYAGNKGIPVAVIAGPEEVDAGKATVRDMRSGEQQQVSAATIVDAVRVLLAREVTGESNLR